MTRLIRQEPLWGLQKVPTPSMFNLTTVAFKDYRKLLLSGLFMGPSVVQLPHYRMIINSHILHNTSLLRCRMHIIGWNQHSRMNHDCTAHWDELLITVWTLCLQIWFCASVVLWFFHSGLSPLYTKPLRHDLLTNILPFLMMVYEDASIKMGCHSAAILNWEAVNSATIFSPHKGFKKCPVQMLPFYLHVSYNWYGCLVVSVGR